MRHRWGFASLCVVALSLNVPLTAQVGPATRSRISGAVDDARRVALPGNVRREVRPENDRGRVADTVPMEHMLLQLKRSAEQESALQQFVDGLHTQGSPNFHRWLSAKEFGDRFGVAPADLDTITAWLQSQGLRVNFVYPNAMVIDFSGNAGEVHRAFQTEIHEIEVRGERHIANVSDPTVPAALASVVSGVVSLHDFRPHTMHRLRQPHTAFTFTDSSGSTAYALVPADLATIYNLNPLFNSGISGQGQTIALIEDTDVFSAADWNTFRSTFGLNAYTSSFTQVHPPAPTGPNNCGAPGIIAPNDAEAILDAEWASASAPSAAIMMAACADTTTTFGGLIAVQNLINAATAPPPIISISYGECETVNGAAANAAYNSTYQQAVAEGVSIFVAAGDSGAAGCDNSVSEATHGIAVNAFASTPYNVAVGGTDFSDTVNGNNAAYWNSTNSNTFGSALSYIPEIPWNDSCAGEVLSTYFGYSPTYGPTSLCNDPLYGPLTMTTVGGGGGPSQCATGTASVNGVVSGSCAGWPKPSWQSIFGNPNDGVRDTPDVSLFAADGLWAHFYVFCWSDTANGGAACGSDPSSWSGAGGTSFASPIMAGIQALINQRAGGRQGNPAPVYYQLAAAEYGPSGNAACNSSNNPAANCTFYDVTQGDIVVDCTGPNCYLGGGSVGVLSTSTTAFSPAYGTSVGWDFATGIGSVNAANLVNGWPVPDFSISAPSTIRVAPGTSTSITVTTTAIAGFSSNLSLSVSGLPAGVTASFNPSVVPAPGSGTSTMTITAASSAALGTTAITVTATGGGKTHNANASLIVASSDFSISSSPATLTIQPGANSTSTISTAVTFGSAATVNLTASVNPSGPTVSLSPTSVTAGGSSTLTVNVGLAVPVGVYTVTVTGAEGSTQHATTITVNVAIPTYTLWSSSTVPSGFMNGDSPVEVGVKFTADRPGFINGIRFYKSSSNTGTHVANLWSTSGQLLASAVFTSETASGWQQVNFASPVAIAANTVYTASYHTNVGFYGFSTNYFATTGWDNAPLHAPSSPASGGNGVFAYGSSSTFPASSYQATNYWVDVAYTVNLNPTNDFSISAAPTTLTIAPGASATSTISTAITSGSAATVNLTATVSPSGPTVSLNPTSIAAGSSSTLTVSVGTAIPVGTYTMTITGTEGSTQHSTTITVNVAIPTYTLWSSSTVPPGFMNGDSPVELGVKFTADNPGFIGGIRFYKSSSNTGTHVGNLWSSTGQLLATAVFTGETASGWQQVNFPSPVAIAANTIYTASYHTNVGFYGFSNNYFGTNGWDNPPLHAPAGPASGGNGVFAYGSSSTFPSSSYQNTNYWVDLVYSPNTGGANDFSINASPTTLTIAPGASATSTISTAITSGSAASVNLTATVNPAGPTVSLSPTSVTAGGSSTLTVNIGAAVPVGVYTVTVTGTEGAAQHSTTVTVNVAIPTYTLWSNSTVPPGFMNGDSPVELGVKFTAEQNGFINGIRFYKSSSNTGTHVANLWSSTGQLLASAVFTGETASGWQQVNFSSPVAIAANTIYTASYHTNVGFYGFSTNYFATNGWDNPPLHAPSGPASGGNGVYAYGSSSSFPSSSYQNTNYWVDVVYSPSTGGANDFSINASPATLTIAPGASATSTISTAVTSGSAASVSLTASVNPSGPTVSISPTSVTAGASSTLTINVGTTVPAGTYTVTVTGTEGSAQHSTTVTVNVAIPTYTLWSSSTVPPGFMNGDNPVELGVKFTADRSGFITGMRFYKSSGNTGTHVANLWSSTGQLLATAVFTGESASGWQQVNFSSPVAIAANTIYTASYHTNVGFYGFTMNYFATNGWDNAPLHAPSGPASGGNGVYAYGSSSSFPSSSYQNTNYWVDVVFQ